MPPVFNMPPVFEMPPMQSAIEAAPVVAAIASAPPQLEDAPAVPTAEDHPQAEVAVPASHAVRRRRRWPWLTLLTVIVLLVAAGAFLWYVSGLIGAGMQVARPGEPFPMTILSSDGGNVAYSGSKGGWDDQGLMGVATIEGGYVQTQSPASVGNGEAETTTRVVTKQLLPPPPAPGQAATLDGWFFPRNPQVGLGLPYEEVSYDSPAGPTPAWLIPGTSTTWVIFTHGRGATPLEGLRIASTVAPLGYPMLLIKYRDDAGAPVDDGLGNFGANEWPDLQAAVQYALDHGARKVVLAGASMGGSITLAFLQHSALADRVAGVFLDAPATDFKEIVRDGARDLGLPDFATSAAMQVAAWRYGIDWAATDYTAVAKQFTTPMLVFQGTEDQNVPAAVTQQFAAAASPGVVTLELVEGAGHVMSWNLDRSRYERLLIGFLAKVAPTS
jgi:alpha-beta hydrolase superfamily lysophospholipase